MIYKFMKDFVVCMIIPTGIGCEIGGHAGDANPYARLLSKSCDKLVLHPNVVNASDINEMPENALYVEGAMLNSFLKGNIKLKEVRQNKILVVTNKLENVTVNAVNAARNTLGADIVDIIEMPIHQLKMKGIVSETYASGEIENFDKLVNMIRYKKQGVGLDFDAIAVHTELEVDVETKMRYLNQESPINPWGGVEAKLSKMIYEEFELPNAHAPIETMPDYDEIVDPRLAAEVIGGSHLYCVLKGLNKAPQPDLNEGLDYIDVMVSPMCYGEPHKICNEKNIPIIYIAENTTINNSFNKSYLKYNDVIASTYLESVGYLTAMKNGLSLR